MRVVILPSELKASNFAGDIIGKFIMFRIPRKFRNFVGGEYFESPVDRLLDKTINYSKKY